MLDSIWVHSGELADNTILVPKGLQIKDDPAMPHVPINYHLLISDMHKNLCTPPQEARQPPWGTALLLGVPSEACGNCFASTD